MRTLILSDLHLGQPSRLPDADAALYSLLSQSDWDRVVFAGDLFELWFFDYAEIAEKHNQILFAIEHLEAEVVYIPGNHDDDFRGIRQLNNMRVSFGAYEFDDGGRTFAVTHGDEFDDFEGVPSKIGAWLGLVADKVASWLMGPGTSVQRTFRHSFAAMGGAREEYIGPIATKAMETFGEDVVIMGHTHMPETRDFDGRLYVNTGDWGPEHLSYVTVTGGDVQLHNSSSG